MIVANIGQLLVEVVLEWIFLLVVKFFFRIEKLALLIVMSILCLYGQSETLLALVR